MAESDKLLEYNGPVDYKTIDRILKKFKTSPEFTGLDKTTGKRVYAIVVECLENIAKHSVINRTGKPVMEPRISVRKINAKIVIKAGNSVTIDKTGELIRKLNQVNYLDEEALNALYEKKISKVSDPEEISAGLGFMLMKLKSGNKIVYNFIRIETGYLYFELKISVNEYIMRKLIIEQTANSPKVILDPDKNRFEISGESRPPDVTLFYKEILRWFEDYTTHIVKTNEVRDHIEFNLDFEYFNSSSAKYILDFCKQISNVHAKGKNLTVKWHYEDDDVDMLEAGREMSRMAKIPFEYVQKGIK